MTINVGLITNDALVLGCDSIASTTTPMIDAKEAVFQKDKDGNFRKDEEGNLVVALDPNGIEMVVTDFKSGVTKMFDLYQGEGTFAGATTAGLAKLNNKPIATLAKEFRVNITSQSPKSIYYIAEQFLAHIRDIYVEDMKETGLPEDYWPSLEFLVGGLGQNDSFPSLYRLDVKRDKMSTEFSEGNAGISWAGQAEAVERLLWGADRYYMQDVIEKFEQYQQEVKDKTTQIIEEVLNHHEVTLPPHVDTEFPAPPSPKSFQRTETGIDFANLPLQDGVNLTSFLVTVQSGKDKFTRGPATVGGRVHIGVVSKSRGGFEMLNEPELDHQYTGFTND